MGRIPNVEAWGPNRRLNLAVAAMGGVQRCAGRLGKNPRSLRRVLEAGGFRLTDELRRFQQMAKRAGYDFSLKQLAPRPAEANGGPQRAAG